MAQSRDDKGRFTSLAAGAAGQKQRAQRPPREGEATGPQTRHDPNRVGSGVFEMLGFGPDKPATLTTYRQMRADPTLAMARMAATAPIKASDFSVDEREGAPSGAAERIDKHLRPMWRRLISEALTALDFGFFAGEVVWDVADGDLAPQRVKRLRPELTKALVDQSTGQLLGIKNRDVEIRGAKAFWFANDPDAGDWYGRPRHENVRAIWSKYEDVLMRSGQYVNLAAAPKPLIQYPEGESKDADGTTHDNSEIAAAVLNELSNGRGVYMPNTLARWASDLMRQGMDPDKLQAWRFSFLEPSSSRGREFVEFLRHFERLMSRGWLVPERSTQEGEHGTKAESVAHIDFVIMAAEQLLAEIVECINQQVINPMLRFNWGEQAVDTVVATPQELVDEALAFLRDLIKQVMVNPNNTDLFLDLLDVDSLLERTGLPKDPGATVTDDGRRPDPDGGEGDMARLASAARRHLFSANGHGG